MNLYMLHRDQDKSLIPESTPGDLQLKTEVYKSSNLDSEKINFILHKIDKEWGSIFCITDPAVNIYEDFSLEIKFQMQDKDIIAINTPQGFTTSLLSIKANSQTRSFFTAILKNIRQGSPLFETYQTQGLVSIFNILSKNYCRIKGLDNRFINIPTIVFDQALHKDISKIQLAELPKAFYSCHFDLVSKSSDINTCLESFCDHRLNLLRSIPSINTYQLKNLKIISNETSNIALNLEQAISNLRLYSDLMKIKIDGYIMEQENLIRSAKPEKEITVSIAYNRPTNLNGKRFEIAEHSRNQLEKKSKHKINFTNCLPKRNSSTIKPNTDKPFLKDLVSKVSKINSDWFGYINADVGFSKGFLDKLNFISAQGYNAISAMTYSISPHANTLIESENSEPLIPIRGGRDLFLIKKELWPIIESNLPDYLIGEPEWDIGLFHILSNTKQVKLFDHCAGDFIFQLYHDQKWNTGTRLSKYNTNESKKFQIPIHQTFTSLKNRSMIS